MGPIMVQSQGPGLHALLHVAPFRGSWPPDPLEGYPGRSQMGTILGTLSTTGTSPYAPMCPGGTSLGTYHR